MMNYTCMAHEFFVLSKKLKNKVPGSLLKLNIQS